MMAGIKDLKKAILTFFQAAAWLLSLVSPFVIAPPFDLPGDDKLVATFTKFFLAIFMALFSYPLLKYDKPAQASKWWYAGILFFVIGLIGSGTYLYTYQHKTVYYSTGDHEYKTMVIGNQLTKEGIDASADILKSKSAVSNDDLLQNFSVAKVEDLSQIWIKDGIDFNNFLLLGLHLLVILLLGTLVLCVFQAIRIKK